MGIMVILYGERSQNRPQISREKKKKIPINQKMKKRKSEFPLQEKLHKEKKKDKIQRFCQIH